MTHDPLPPGMHECDWCGDLAAVAWFHHSSDYGIRESRSWIACSEEHLDLLLARDRWNIATGGDNE